MCLALSLVVVLLEEVEGKGEGEGEVCPSEDSVLVLVVPEREAIPNPNWKKENRTKNLGLDGGSRWKGQVQGKRNRYQKRSCNTPVPGNAMSSTRWCKGGV